MFLYYVYTQFLWVNCSSKGLRAAALVGVLGTTLGTWIKVFSVQPHLFWVTFLGQTVVFVAQICILSLPPMLASVWFPENEVN